MEHNFRIISIRQIEAHFDFNGQFQPEKSKQIEIKNTIEVTPIVKGRMLHLRISVVSDGSDQPFRFSVVWEGVFEFEGNISGDDARRIADINCAAIVFPYVRESVADLTRRSGIPPFNLAPVNFVALHARRESPSSKPAAVKKAKKKKA
jgi:preprotein translocase subunit SecB